VQDQFFVPFFTYVSAVTNQIGGTPSSPDSSSTLLGDLIVFSEWDNVPWDIDMQHIFQNYSILRYPESQLELRDKTREAFAPYLTPQDRYSFQAASQVQADVVMINGDLDSNTELISAKRCAATTPSSIIPSPKSIPSLDLC
jgi:hypothetical protein